MHRLHKETCLRGVAAIRRLGRVEDPTGDDTRAIDKLRNELLAFTTPTCGGFQDQFEGDRDSARSVFELTYHKVSSNAHLHQCLRHLAKELKPRFLGNMQNAEKRRKIELFLVRLGDHITDEDVPFELADSPEPDGLPVIADNHISA